MQSTSCDLLFVYGTLMGGQTALPDWHKRAGARLLGAARARGRLYSFGRYPGAKFDSQADGYVHGELYRLNDVDAFSFLDEYEGLEPIDNQSRGFAREIIAVETAEGRIASAWAYVYKGSTQEVPVVRSGDWSRFIDRE